jgi:predicted nucleic acid-binding protein
VRSAEKSSQDLLIEHYFRFVLAEGSGDLRERLQRGLVELALKTGNPEHEMSAEAAQRRIEDATGLPEYPPGLVAQGLRQLCDRGEAERRGGSNGQWLYRLRLGRFRVLDQALKHAEAQDHEMRASVITRVEARTGQLDRDSKAAVERAFQRFLGTMLATLGERCASRLVQDRSAVDIDYPDIDEDLSAAIAGLTAQLRQDAKLAFEASLREPSAKEQEYLYSAGQVYYVAELLHLDPALQTLQRERFKDTTVFLDTNLLLALLLESLENHEAVRTMVSMCRAAGFTLVYAERTAEELDDLITGAEREFSAAPPIDLRAASKFAGAVENPFLSDWLRSYPELRASWRQYRARITAWRSLLEDEGVDLRQLDSANTGDAYYQRLSTSLGAQRAKAAQGQRQARRPRAVEHDADVVSSIRELVLGDQAPPHPFGARFWFVTLDRRLVDCARGRSPEEGVSPCLLADEWVQYVSPFLSSDVSRLDSAAAFTGLLSSRFIPSLGHNLSLDQLRVFTEPSVAALTDGLSEEEACKAVAVAHREAVKVKDKDQEDTRAVERLATLAERERAKHRDHDERKATQQLVRERAEFQASARVSRQAVEERDATIGALSEEIATLRQHQRTSLRFRAGNALARMRRWWSRGRAWARLHPAAARIGISVIALAILAEILGYGGTVGRIAYLLVLVVTLLAIDFGQLFSKLRRWLR